MAYAGRVKVARTQQRPRRILSNNAGGNERLVHSHGSYMAKDVAGITSTRQLHLQLVNDTES